MIDSLQDFVSSLPPALQGLAVIAAGAIPFVESYFGTVIGIVVGLSPPVAVMAAATGNIASMLVLVLGADNMRRKLAGAPDEHAPATALSPRRRRIRRWFHRYGVPGVSLLGQTMLPSQITSAALVSFGARRRAVIFWQIISIVLWGTIFATLATLGVDLLGDG